MGWGSRYPSQPRCPRLAAGRVAAGRTPRRPAEGPQSQPRPRPRRPDAAAEADRPGGWDRLSRPGRSWSAGAPPTPSGRGRGGAPATTDPRVRRVSTGPVTVLREQLLLIVLSVEVVRLN